MKKWQRRKDKNSHSRWTWTAASAWVRRRAVGQGIAHKLRGEHETEEAARHAVGIAEVEKIIEDWPAAQKNIARQMLDKYGPPNEATPTKLFWYGNSPCLTIP